MTKKLAYFELTGQLMVIDDIEGRLLRPASADDKANLQKMSENEFFEAGNKLVRRMMTDFKAKATK